MTPYTTQSEWELKQMMINIGKRIWQRGFVAANDGNFSVRINEKEILTTPTGVSKGFMTPDMIIKMTMDGKVISRGSKYRPSSEVKMLSKASLWPPKPASLISIRAIDGGYLLSLMR